MRAASWICLYSLVVLQVVIWILLFMRALVKRKLINNASKFFERGDLRHQWEATHRGPLRILGAMKRLRLIQGAIAVLPPELKSSLGRFRFLHRILMATIVIFIALIFSAEKICN